jgi:hypothetical protein
LALTSVATIIDNGVVTVAPPPIPVRLKLNVPDFAVDAAVSVKVLVFAPVPRIAAGENAAETPAGSPGKLSATVLLNPLGPTPVTVSVIFDPAVRLAEALDSEIWNGGVTVTVKEAVCVIPAPAAVSVSL